MPKERKRKRNPSPEPPITEAVSTPMEIPATVETIPTFVVGIGASAGGLESLENLFRHLPANTGMAFVVIQHLSPDFKSMMYELLARDTEMQIHRVEDGMPVEANHVYLLPPRKEIEIKEGKLLLIDKDPTRGITLPIDRFFDSLAEDCGPRAVAIILSGSGSDGSRGIRAISDAGGLVICESQDTAKFDGMPLSAQATGLVDVIVPPEKIGWALLRHAIDPVSLKKGMLTYTTGGTSIEKPRGIEAIYDLLRQVYEMDFSVYKESTVLRRIHRRLSMVESPTIEAYADRLAHDREELDALHEDLLIGVTQFFRDADSFEYLASDVLPELIKRKDPKWPIRAWIAGCGTGEEAYSIAILFHEALRRVGRSVHLKIFATDVHKASLEAAGRGIYRSDTLRNASPTHLKQYFTRKKDHFHVAREIRESIVFATHNVLRDAPFTDLDFVSCRNLLIYFQPAAQTKVLSMFHFGLNAGGYLFLGSSESPGELGHEFESVNERHKVFRKWRDSRVSTEIRLPSSRPTGMPTLPGMTIPPAAIRGFRSQPKSTETSLIGVYDHLLNRYMPPALLINDKRELVDSFSGAEKLLRLQTRRPSLDILELIDPSVRTTLAGALQRAVKGNGPVRFSGVKIRGDSGEQTFNLTVESFRHPVTHATHYLLAFDPSGPVTPLPPGTFEVAPDSGDVSRAQIRQLEDELRYTKENLQATIEELETSNEELQAANEELVASNEELQSTNEELHSVNEELYTVNAECQRRISELAELNQDMHHLLENTDVATVFLDRELRIRKFTSRVRGIFDLLDQDIGRPIASFAHRIQLDDMLDQLRKVQDSGVPHQTEVYSVDGVCYLLKILPYRVNELIDGVVITMIDVSSLEDLRGRLRWMSAIVESTEDAIIGIDLRGMITSWNLGAERLYGYQADEVLGKHVRILMPEGQASETELYMEQLRRGEAVRTLDTIRRRKDGTEIHISLTVSPVRDKRNNVIGVSKIGRDISERIEIEHEMRQQARLKEQFLAMLSHELRNPLNAVLNASRLLRDPRCDETGRVAAGATIERQSTMIASLLNDLLDISRIAQAKIELKAENIDLTQLIDAVRETTLPQLNKHQARLEFETSDGPLIVHGDPARLIQIHVNLIHNAAKYSPPGKLIRVTMCREVDLAVISVIDQGVGISPEFLPVIFDPFVQSDETRNRAEGGLGVGLTLVKSLVELHGGTVEAQSAGRDMGSTFTVRLPLAVVASQKNRKSIRQTGERHAEPPQGEPASSFEHVMLDRPHLVPPPPAAHVRRIVLVDDMADNRDMLTSLLRLDGHTVLTADDGETGLNTILELRPDVALVDIGLPGIDGYEVARRVRSQLDPAATRLIALTGYGQRADVERALAAGFDAHLVKPVVLEQLNKLLEINAPPNAGTS